VLRTFPFLFFFFFPKMGHAVERIVDERKPLGGRHLVYERRLRRGGAERWPRRVKGYNPDQTTRRVWGAPRQRHRAAG